MYKNQVFAKLKSRPAVAEVAVMLKEYSKWDIRIKGKRRTSRKLKISKNNKEEGLAR